MLILAVEESTMSVGRARASAPNSACRIRVSGRLATVRYDTVPYLHTCTHNVYYHLDYARGSSPLSTGFLPSSDFRNCVCRFSVARCSSNSLHACRRDAEIEGRRHPTRDCAA